MFHPVLPFEQALIIATTILTFNPGGHFLVG
jgi:hypothetical protein